MPELYDRVLGTAPEKKIHHALQRTGSRLVGDRFLASYLANCLNIVDGLGPVHKFMLTSEGLKRGAAPELIKTLVAQADDNLLWAAEMKAEGYHRTNVLSFLSFWAAYEAGNENIITAILSTIQLSAVAATEKFAQGKYVITNWPWTEDQCLEIAQKLDQKAKDKTQDGGWDVTARLTTLYGWLGVVVTVPKPASEKFNEASMVRNILLHRYGRLGQRDIARAPNLAEFENKAIQLTRPRLNEYYQAVVDVHIAIMTGISTTGWESID
jgi:hypothetical protein